MTKNNTSIQTEEPVMVKMMTLPGGARQIEDLLIAAEVIMELEEDMVIDEDVLPELVVQSKDETENVDPDNFMEEDSTDDGTQLCYSTCPHHRIWQCGSV